MLTPASSGDASIAQFHQEDTGKFGKVLMLDVPISQTSAPTAELLLQLQQHPACEADCH